VINLADTEEKELGAEAVVDLAADILDVTPEVVQILEEDIELKGRS
jgi:hypothetical protein